MRPLHAAFVLCAFVLPTAAADAPKKTPLDDYLAKPDPTYAWKLVKTIPGGGVTSYVIDLKSQTWRSTSEVDRPVWQHWLTIIKPDKVTSDTALLTIGGGRNDGVVPAAVPGDAIDRARRTGTVVVSLGQVPNQPLIFNNDGKERVEDDLIAYCDIKFVETGDPTWVTRLPMVKSAVRAMDAATLTLSIWWTCRNRCCISSTVGSRDSTSWRTGSFMYRLTSWRTPPSSVAENSIVWCSDSMRCSSFCTCGMKPRSAMRSASSTTSISTARRDSSRRSSRSMSRPGVPMTASTPLRRAAIWRSIDAPP